jgi:hypothetical protein
MTMPYAFEILPPGPFGGKLSLLGEDYRFDFPPVCAHCAKPASRTSPVHLLSPLGQRRQSVWIKIPYCDEHLKRVRILTQVKFGIYILSYVLTALLLMLYSAVFLHTGFGDLAGFLASLVTLGAFTIFLWGPLVYPVFRFVLIKPLMRIVEPDGLYQPNTNTLGLSIQLRSLNIVVGFANAEPAQKFARANDGNARVKPLGPGGVRAS